MSTIAFSDSSSQMFLANLSQIENGNQKVQNQISSGFQVSVPEDSPDQITQLLQLQANLSQNTQVQTNLQNVQTSATTADQTISSILQLVDNASSLGSEGASSTVSQQTRQELAQQVQGVFDQVVSLTQISIGGRYVFSGDADQQPSYQLDPSSPTGVDRLSTALNTQLVQDSNGASFSVGMTAGQLFDHRNTDDSIAPDNLYNALNALYTALNTNDTTGITTAIGSIQTASAYVNTQQGFYGALENRLTSALSTASAANVSLSSQISSIRDTNLSEAAIQLTQGQTDLQAALEAQSKIPTTSLFNYLG